MIVKYTKIKADIPLRFVIPFVCLNFKVR